MDGPVYEHNQDRDGKTRRLSCMLQKKNVVKEDSKTTLYLLHTQATFKYIENASSLSKPLLLFSRIVCVYFIPALFLYVVQPHSYLYSLILKIATLIVLSR